MDLQIHFQELIDNLYLFCVGVHSFFHRSDRDVLHELQVDVDTRINKQDERDTMGHQTEHFLHKLKEIKMRKILAASCSSFYWVPSVY